MACSVCGPGTVRCEAEDRQGLERLWRCITRVVLACERVQCDAARRLVLKLETPWRDGTMHLVMSALEFMQRLAAQVPRPRLQLIRLHGVLAPNAKQRAQIVPAGAHDDHAGARSDPEAVEPDEGHRWVGLAHRLSAAARASLRHRHLHCPNCGGECNIIAAILETAPIERILEHLGPPAPAPPRTHAREPVAQAA